MSKLCHTFLQRYLSIQSEKMLYFFIYLNNPESGTHIVSPPDAGRGKEKNMSKFSNYLKELLAQQDEPIARIAKTPGWNVPPSTRL